MKKRGLLFLLVTVTILLCSTFFSITTSASQAGVGVLNVPPTFRMIRVVQQDDFIRVYITISDYNSWEDIYSASVTLEDYGLETAEFFYKQYEDRTSYIKTNEFNETSGNNDLLVKEKCSYEHSSKRETVDDRCNIEILFVFHTDWFTRLNVLVSDREGSTATAHIDYNAEEMMRNSEIIVIPGVDEPISVGIPPYLLNLLAMFMAITGTALVVKKRNRIHTERVAYENG